MKNIVIPMSWEWVRFSTKSAIECLKPYRQIKLVGEVPKPYIDINWKSMIEIVIEWFNISWRIILIINSKHVLSSNIVLNTINKILRKFDNVIVIESTKTLEWPASIVMEAKNYINNDNELIILNSDQFFINNFTNSFFSHISGTKNNWTIVTYHSIDLKNSFAILDEHKNIINVIEKPKEIIPNSFATTWVYYWKNGKHFIEWTEQMIKKWHKVNWEYYIAPVYSENISSWLAFDIFHTENVILVWTPIDLVLYIQWIKK